MQIPNDWLTERVESVPTSYARSLPPQAALRTRMAWQKLKGRAEEGDEVWGFSSPKKGWQRPGKYVGYALVRDGRVLESTLITDE